MLKILFPQDSVARDLFCGTSPGSEPSLLFSSAWGLSLFKVTVNMTLLV